MKDQSTAIAETGSKRVLVITHIFPPVGGVGTFRVTKYVKYLRRFGWEPVVITAKETAYGQIDHSLEKDIPPDVHIYRLPVWKRRFINDEGIRWIPSVLRKARFIVGRERPAVAYLTGGPFYPLILGPLLNLRFGIPYVVDLRDPWKLARRSSPMRRIKPRLGGLLTNILEPIVVRNASRVICVTEPMREEYRAEYKNESPSKFVTITNGYDPEDFDHIQPLRFADFTIVYTGKFGVAAGFRDPSAFFQAMQILQGKGLRAHFVHVGVVEPRVVELAENMGIKDLIEFIGPKPYNETLAYAKGANLLLVIGGGSRWEPTTKVFDYIGCKRPILAIAPPDGAIAEVVKKVQSARLVDSQNPAEIAAALEDAYLGKLNQNDTQELPKLYEREHLTGMLADVLNEAITMRNRNKA
jgi:glycosyltransferase involved in cell wall biosynthesis